MWVKNLNKKINTEHIQDQTPHNNRKTLLIAQFKKILPQFLENRNK